MIFQELLYCVGFTDESSTSVKWLAQGMMGELVSRTDTFLKRVLVLLCLSFSEIFPEFTLAWSLWLSGEFWLFEWMLEGKMSNIFFCRIWVHIHTKCIQYIQMSRTKSALQYYVMEGIIITTRLHLQDAIKCRTYHQLNNFSGKKIILHSVYTSLRCIPL